MISKILDWYFSLPTEYPIFFLACVPAVFSYYMRKALDRQDREIKKSLFIFIFIGGLIWISVLFFTTKRSISAYWGNLKKIEFILFREPNLWVIDTVTDNSSDHPNHIFRLNIIKIETGERVFRSIIGNNFNKIYKTDSKLVLMNIQDEEKLEDCIIYNLSDFNQSLNLNPEYLENSLIPTPGIQSLKFYSENTIKITNKKGYIYYYNIITKKITENAQIEESENNLTIQKYKIFNPKENKVYFEFEGDRRKDLYIYRENQKIKTKLNYLDPGFLKINQKNNSVLISSFETTDNKYLILTAIDFSGNEKWQFKLKDFFPDITIEVKYLNDFYLSEDQLFFIINDYLFRMDSNNGRLIKVVKI